MQIDADQLLANAIRDGIREGVKGQLSASHNNPLEKIIKVALEAQAGAVLSLLSDCVGACMGDAEFRAAIATSVRALLAKTLVHRFGGELEKQINALKSDPATRARITLAIEGIVKDRSLTT